MILFESPPLFLQKVSQNFLNLFLKVKITGMEFLKDLKYGIILSNHFDFIDLVIPIFYLEKKIYVLYTENPLEKSIFKIILNENLNPYLNLFNLSLIPKDELSENIQKISKNNLLFIFPELKPSETGIVNPFSYELTEEIYLISLNHKIPIIPCGIQGTHELSNWIQKLNFELIKINVQFHIGNPIFLENTIEFSEFKEEIEKQVYALTQHPERRSRGRTLIRTDARKL
ncbi:MAG: lysophospholipid acyltransferase family protein [Leptonema sp. (in: bacteria)]